MLDENLPTSTRLYAARKVAKVFNGLKAELYDQHLQETGKKHKHYDKDKRKFV